MNEMVVRVAAAITTAMSDQLRPGRQLDPFEVARAAIKAMPEAEVGRLALEMQAAGLAVRNWMDKQGRSGFLRTNDQAPGWHDYVRACAAFDDALAAREADPKTQSAPGAVPPER